MRFLILASFVFPTIISAEMRLPLNNRPIPELTNLIFRYQLGRSRTAL